VSFIRKGKILFISAVFCAAGAAAFSACAVTNVDGVEIYTDSYLSLTDEKMYFSLGEKVDEVSAVAALGITVKNGKGEETPLTREALMSGYFRLGAIDTSTVGDKSVNLLFNGETYALNYCVDSYTVNFYLPGDILYKSVSPSGKNGEAAINLTTDYNYAADSSAISSDEESALKFCGWKDVNGNLVTGKYILTADSDHTASVDFYADFLTDKEFEGMNLYYENGEKVFGGLSPHSTYIWDETFYIPESVTKVDLYSTLSSMGGVENLYIPSTAGINYTYLYSPYPSASIKSISVSGDNTDFSSYEGGLYTKDYSVLIYYPAASASFTASENTNKINDFAFSYSSANELDLTGIVYFGKGCFAYSDVRSINASTSAAFDDEAYLFSSMCEAYNEYDGEELIASYYVLYENNVPVYYLDYVSQTVKSYKIKEGTEEINAYAFAGCYNLKNVTIPEGVTHIGAYAFAYCEKLALVNLPKSLKSAGEGAFYGCSSLSSVNRVPEIDYISSSSVQLSTLPDYFFYGTSLTNAELSEGFISVGKYSFAQAEDMEEITLPDSLLYLGEGAFYSCASLSEVNLSEKSSLERICTEAFAYCDSLEEFPFSAPKSFKKIEPRAFMYSGLKGFSFNDSYTKIDESAFEKCEKLNNISFGEELTNIGKCAFKDCSSLTDIDFTNITDVDESAFENCTALKKVDLTDGVFIIESYVFRGCTSLEVINMGESVGRFGEYEFDKEYNVITAAPAAIGCTALKEINVNSENLTFSSERGILYNYARNVLYFVPAAYEKTLEIETSVTEVYPYAVSDLSVEAFSFSEGTSRVYDYALYSLKNLKEIYISSSVRVLSDKFFTECPLLSAITVDKENLYYYNAENGDVYNTCPDYEEDEDIISKKGSPAFVLS